jgi:hypothetical protein
LILGDGEVMTEEGEIVRLELDHPVDEEEEVVECNSMGVLCAIGEYRTMKIEGVIENVNVLVLIDSGASHNFISPSIATALGLTVTSSNTRSIRLGDGHKILSQGTCEQVKMKLGPIEVIIDALVLELGGLDVVLGMSWLSTLGKVVMDWKSLSMQFRFQGQAVKLQGQNGRQNQQHFLNMFLDGKLNRDGLEWWFSQNNDIGEMSKARQDNFTSILEQFPNVFKDQIQLPPDRSQVHHIKLIPGHGPINVRPYKYPHHQKEEIERQVAELLSVGVIRPSMSEYSSPVILVKKKDKSWRMCVDYRALKYQISILSPLLMSC